MRRIPHARFSLALASLATTAWAAPQPSPDTNFDPTPSVARAPSSSDFDPYDERPVRGFLGVSGLGAFSLGQSNGLKYTDVGGGFSAWGGLDIGPVIALEVSYTSSFNPPALGCTDLASFPVCNSSFLVLQMFGADLRLHIPTGTPIVPYIQGGGSAAWLGRNAFVADTSGGGFDAGGGIDIWLDRNLSFGTRVLYRGVWLATNNLDGTNTYVGMLTVDLNFAVHF